jgi:hypothetical protein
MRFWPSFLTIYIVIAAIHIFAFSPSSKARFWSQDTGISFVSSQEQCLYRAIGSPRIYFSKYKEDQRVLPECFQNKGIFTDAWDSTGEHIEIQ